MAGIHPVVRYLIACENITKAPDDPNRISLLNLVSAVRSGNDPPFPFRLAELCVYLQLAACRGPAEGRIEIVHADSGRPAFRSRTRNILFPADPLEVVGLSFRIRDCLFSEAGLYWLQFWYNEEMIAQEPLLLKG